ncbi:DsbA family protein [Kangiella sediminilitoris]|uniref:Thioredoxin n=1 Tax=Kangiella sediminilitoris TaxID=1144748 RepID=A0A1B3BB20_9GAMM|nr:DsbA family protein [Kangiella sediminilitoris]AOE49966.1 thioredoxin [Kangiella sediminilitoris]
MAAKLYYFHDPMCSWCWGFAPTWQQLNQSLKNIVDIEYVLGGLAPDSNEPMPHYMQKTIRGYWEKIENLLGTRFNYNFWTECQPKRSTYPACRAVIAAKEQGKESEMIVAIQKAYYLGAMNPSELDTLVFLADYLKLNIESFKTSIVSERIDNELQRQIQVYRSLSFRGFPSLTLEIEEQSVPIEVDYQCSDLMYDKIISFVR